MAASPTGRSAGPPHLLLLAGVGGLSAVDALAAARRATPRVSVVYVTAWAAADPVRAAWQRDAGDGTVFLTADGLDAAVTAGLAAHARLPLDGVVTYSELLLRPQAEITDRLGLPGNPPHAVRTAQSKAGQRAALAAHRVPAPRSARIRDREDLAAALAEVGLPAVFKPSLGAGSQGVVRVADRAGLEAAYAEGTRTSTPFIQEDDGFLLEEPMPVEGDERSPYADYVSVESLLTAGRVRHLAVTDRLRLRHGYVEEGLVVPSRHDAATLAAIRDCAERAIRAVGLAHGAVHTEIAVTPDGPKVIEVNARAGGPLPNLLRTACGYDFATEIARNALGWQAAPCPPAERVAWCRFVPIPRGRWRVAGQRGAAEARDRFPDLVRIALRFAPGGEARRDTTQHLAVFTVAAPTAEEARRIAEEVEEFLAIRLERLDDDPSDGDGGGDSAGDGDGGAGDRAEDRAGDGGQRAVKADGG